MYIAHIADLRCDIYAVGKTEAECRKNLIKAFLNYLMRYRVTLDEWIEDINVSMSDYNYDMWRFLTEYYAAHMFNVTKGYALGWEQEEDTR